MTLEEQIQLIIDAIKRGKGQFALGSDSDGRCMLAVGAPKVVAIPEGGHLVMIGLSKTQCTELRDLCNALLEGARG